MLQNKLFLTATVGLKTVYFWYSKVKVKQGKKIIGLFVERKTPHFLFVLFFANFLKLLVVFST